MYLPLALDPETVPGCLRDRVSYLCSTIHLHWQWRWKWLGVEGEHGYVRLTYNLLEKVIPRKELAEVKKLLIGRGIIECDGKFARGKALVTTGGHGRTIACAICHGQDLHGMGEVPAIAGRHPDYIVRQLWSLQTGERAGTWAVLMNAVVEKLSTDDMLAIAAYVGSQKP